ncbi:hypothetical protein BDR03DRAFT_982518 [Suillus americanus]|nr:hypothetical protein BDR03DRAFT_982518 [Suillus americanus]
MSTPRSFEEHLTKALLQSSKDCPRACSSSCSTQESLATRTSILHQADIAHFAKAGFDALVGTLASQLGFQADIIKTVYGHLTSYEQTVQVVESMQEAAEECTVAEILSKNEESSYKESGYKESSYEESNYEESTKEESMKEESMKEESMKEESVKEESMKEESVKEESVKEESVKEESMKEENND